jgi:uncharacterized protein YjbI with pentapeptide repeats
MFSDDMSLQELSPVIDRSEQNKRLHSTTFNRCDFKSAEFNASIMCFIDFNVCGLYGSNFTGAKLLGASFYDCTLDRTDFSLANCQRAAFTIVTSGKQMKFFNADCTNAQFKHGDFKGLDFTSAILDRSLFDDP